MIILLHSKNFYIIILISSKITMLQEKRYRTLADVENDKILVENDGAAIISPEPELVVPCIEVQKNISGKLSNSDKPVSISPYDIAEFIKIATVFNNTYISFRLKSAATNKFGNNIFTVSADVLNRLIPEYQKENLPWVDKYQKYQNFIEIIDGKNFGENTFKGFLCYGDVPMPLKKQDIADFISFKRLPGTEKIFGVFSLSDSGLGLFGLPESNKKIYAAAEVVKGFLRDNPDRWSNLQWCQDFLCAYKSFKFGKKTPLQQK